MKIPFRLDSTRALQAGFLVLLAICAGQVVFWILDDVEHTRVLSERLMQQYQREINAAQRMVALGIDPNEVDRLFPELIFSSGPERITVNPQALSLLREDQRRRMYRYGWEGSFFLIVLVSAMAVIAHAIRQDAELRRRQQNFLAAVTHEFKSPLASLRLSAETLALRDPPPPARQKIVQRVLDDLTRFETMIGNILDTARLEEGRVTLRPERVVLGAAVRQVFEELGERARAGNVALEAEIPGDLDVEADPVAVRTVLRNLVDNAVKATVANGGGRVRVAAHVEDDAAAIEVRDDGVGFAPDEAQKLFDKFYRPGDELRRTSSGSGLGLYIVRRFMQLTGGRVAARSDGPGKGATFTLRWPVARPDDGVGAELARPRENR